MQKICFILTTDIAVKAFLINHLRELSLRYSVTVVVNTDNEQLLSSIGISAEVIPLKIARKIDIFKDVYVLFFLIRFFKHRNFDAIHSVTPKAGLLGMLAAFFCRIPNRVHTFTGQVWANKKGFKRTLLKWVDTLLAALTTQVIVDSPSQQTFLINERVINNKKSHVFALGSIAGVDTKRFKFNAQDRIRIRKDLAIETDCMVYLFLGRLNQDKGVLDLAKAFIAAQLENTFLLFVGPDEQGMQKKIGNLLLSNEQKNIGFISYTNEPQAYMAASDVLCLPSYREGFGSVIIEAASCGIPAIASNIYGITDALVHNKTGLLHEPGNLSDIQSKLSALYNDKVLYHFLAKNAQERAITNFDSKILTQAWCDFYANIFSTTH